MQQNRIKKDKIKAKNYRVEAKYYFEDNEFDYYKAVNAYKEDLKSEEELFTQEKEMKKRIKKGGVKVTDGFGDMSTSGRRKEKCTIF